MLSLLGSRSEPERGSLSPVEMIVGLVPTSDGGQASVRSNPNRSLAAAARLTARGRIAFPNESVDSVPQFATRFE